MNDSLLVINHSIFALKMFQHTRYFLYFVQITPHFVTSMIFGEELDTELDTRGEEVSFRNTKGKKLETLVDKDIAVVQLTFRFLNDFRERSAFTTIAFLLLFLLGLCPGFPTAGDIINHCIFLHFNSSNPTTRTNQPV